MREFSCSRSTICTLRPQWAWRRENCARAEPAYDRYAALGLDEVIVGGIDDVAGISYPFLGDGWYAGYYNYQNRRHLYGSEPRRALFMADALGTYLYSVSAVGLLASDAAAPATELGRKPLPGSDTSCCVIAPGGDGDATGGP